MIKKSIGVARNFLANPKEHIKCIKHYLTSDEVLVLGMQGNDMFIYGHVSADHYSIYMLGNAAAVAYKRNQESLQAQGVSASDYLDQLAAVYFRGVNQDAS